MNLKFEKITNIERILEAAAKNSSYEKQVQSLLEPHNFERLVTHVVVVGNLANLFPDHSQELFELLIKPKNFLNLVANASQICLLTDYFPDNKKALFQLLLEPQNFQRLVTDISSVCILANKFPKKREKLFHLFIQPDNFQRLVRHTRHIFFLVNQFPDYKEQLLQQLMQPDNFQRLVTSNTMLNDLATIFPDCEILQKDTISEVLKEIKCNTSEQKAYTRGAAVGFFDQILPQEHSAQIGSLLDRASGARLAQTTKKAADTARNEHDKLHKPK
ncbi:MAG: hypothetical protein BGO90_12420 [Legionella sp. 40-6]|nr:hypothetical protein [Legionella sp.]OJY46008.1 MAG: hypothetical protein BGO90_12420 [Legionella sp. 40-6]